MIKKNLYTGIVLIVLGVLFLLYNLDIFDLAWILFLLSIALLIRYALKRDVLYLAIGLGLLAFSSLSLVDRYIFISLNIKPFVYLFVAACGLIYLYYKGGERNWLILGSVLMALAFNNIIGQIWPMFLPWGKFFLLALALYLCYLGAYRANHIVWPRYISYILLAAGGIQIFVNSDMLRFTNLRLSYLIPLIIILIGLRIIYLAMEK